MCNVFCTPAQTYNAAVPEFRIFLHGRNCLGVWKFEMFFSTKGANSVNYNGEGEDFILRCPTSTTAWYQDRKFQSLIQGSRYFWGENVPRPLKTRGGGVLSILHTKCLNGDGLKALFIYQTLKLPTVQNFPWDYNPAASLNFIGSQMWSAVCMYVKWYLDQTSDKWSRILDHVTTFSYHQQDEWVTTTI